MIEVDVVWVMIDPATESPVVLLMDGEKKKVLPIWVGNFEAGAILSELQGAIPPRPITHDLVKMLFKTVNIDLLKVVITDIYENTYYANMIVKSGDRTIPIDCRPSDGIAVALRMKSPVFVEEKVFLSAIPVEEFNKKLEEERYKDILEKMNDTGKYKM